MCGVEPAPLAPDLRVMDNHRYRTLLLRRRRERAGPALRPDRTETRADAAALDAKLDLALAHTFPASDPVAVGGATGTEPPARPVDRQSPIIDG